jgi:hypothetical protein
VHRIIKTVSSLVQLRRSKGIFRGFHDISPIRTSSSKFQNTGIESLTATSRYCPYSFFTSTSCSANEEQRESLVELADMPVLASLAKDFQHNFSVSEMNKTLLIASQRLYNMTPALFDAYDAIGFHPKNTFILSKYYSTNPSVKRDLERAGFHVITDVVARRYGAYQAAFNAAVSRLWEEVSQKVKEHDITNIIILSDGSNCLGAIPPDIESRVKVIGIEQNLYGLNHPGLTGLSFPIINVASSATKRYLESPLIIQEIMASLREYYGNLDNIRFGLVGMEHLGSALAQHFSQLGYAYKAYDKDPAKLALANIPGYARTSLLPSFVYNSDVIISTTGTDITSDMSVFEEISGQIDLVSVSSGDYEFTTLLIRIQEIHKSDSSSPHVLSDLNYKTRFGGQITILRGGYPINFNDQMGKSSAKEIQLTHALLLAAVIQARTMQNMDTDWLSGGTFFQLSPSLQQRIAQDWLAQSDLAKYIDDEMKANFTDTQWIEDQSGGNRFRDLFASCEHNAIKKLHHNPCR